MTNKLILGTVQMGIAYGVNNSTGKISKHDSALILAEAYRNGIRTLDTAEAYGDAHDVIGHYHRQNPSRKFRVITKISGTIQLPGLRKKVEAMMEQLEVESLEALMFHSFHSYKKSHAWYIDCQKMLEEKIVQQIGVSVYLNEEVENLSQDNLVGLIQLPFNLLDNVSQRGQCLQKAKLNRKTIHSRSVFLQGLFFKNPADRHPVAEKLKDQLMDLRRISDETNIPMQGMALAYCLQQPLIDQVLIGVDSIDQLTDNLKAQFELSPDILARIDSIATTDSSLLNPALWT